MKIAMVIVRTLMGLLLIFASVTYFLLVMGMFTLLHGLSRSLFARALMDRINSPTMLDQGATSLCGPAVFLYNVLMTIRWVPYQAAKLDYPTESEASEPAVPAAE